MLSPAGLGVVPVLQATIAAIYDGEPPLLLTPPQLFSSEYIQQRCFARQRKLEGRGFVVVATERSRLLFEGRFQEIRYVNQPHCFVPEGLFQGRFCSCYTPVSSEQAHRFRAYKASVLEGVTLGIARGGGEAVVQRELRRCASAHAYVTESGFDKSYVDGTLCRLPDYPALATTGQCDDVSDKAVFSNQQVSACRS